MISEKMQNAFLNQINKEFYSEYLYLAMKAYFMELDLEGFANWMDVQIQEEHAHAMGMYNYVIERGGKIELQAIEKPQNSWENPYELFKAVLEHERFVTSKINELADVAEETKDRAASLFISWYIKEQVEEEASVENILAQLELIGNDKSGLFALNQKLMARTFVTPVIG